MIQAWFHFSLIAAHEQHNQFATFKMCTSARGQKVAAVEEFLVRNGDKYFCMMKEVVFMI